MKLRATLVAVAVVLPACTGVPVQTDPPQTFTTPQTESVQSQTPPQREDPLYPKYRDQFFRAVQSPYANERLIVCAKDVGSVMELESAAGSRDERLWKAKVMETAFCQVQAEGLCRGYDKINDRALWVTATRDIRGSCSTVSFDERDLGAAVATLDEIDRLPPLNPRRRFLESHMAASSPFWAYRSSGDRARLADLTESLRLCSTLLRQGWGWKPEIKEPCRP